MTNREEVAKKLREVSTARTTDEVYVALLNCIGITYDYANLFNRLADLIEPMYEPCPVWTAWVESLKNGDVVDRFAYDLIMHGGDMGPNGNTWDGVDEGTVLTNQLFDKFKADFKKEIEASDSGVVQD